MDCANANKKKSNANFCHLLLLGSLLLGSLFCYAQKISPYQGKWVQDQAKLLSAKTVAELQAYLRDVQDSTSNQIAVYIIPSLEDQDIGDLALAVFDQWKLGDAQKDNGVLLLIAPNDRKVRIEVGKGLEGVLTDALCNRIIRGEIAPYFRLENYNEGVKAGVRAIVQASKNEYRPTKRGLEKSSIMWPSLLLVGLVIFALAISKRNHDEIKRFAPRDGGRRIPPFGGGGFSSMGGGGISGGGGASGSW